MPDQHDNPIELHNWLRVATLGLDVVEREQVRESGLALYQRMLARELKAGMVDTEARRLALAALGDPWRLRGEMLGIGRRKDKDMLGPIKERWALRKLPYPVSLDAWFEIATGQLTEDARERVEAEIENHYQDAIAAGQEAGLGLAEAERAALEGLGSARLARRMFSRTHLTKEDVRQVEELRRNHRPLVIGLFKLFTYVAIFTVAHVWALLRRDDFIDYLRLLGFASLIWGDQGRRNIESFLAIRLQGDLQRFMRYKALLHAANIAPLMLFFAFVLITNHRDDSFTPHGALDVALKLAIALCLVILFSWSGIQADARWLRKMRVLGITIRSNGPDQHA